MNVIKITAKDRFWKKVQIPQFDDGCWNWLGATESNKGYGQFWLNGRMILAHRFSYQLLVGSIPKGLGLDHLCRNTACVRPNHLEPVTQKINTLRSPIALAVLNAKKTHCPQGHPYNLENTYKYEYQRVCKECAKSRSEKGRVN